MVLFFSLRLIIIALRLPTYSATALNDSFGFDMPSVDSFPGLLPGFGTGLRFGLLLLKLCPGEDLKSSIEVVSLRTKVILFCNGLS